MHNVLVPPVKYLKISAKLACDIPGKHEGNASTLSSMNDKTARDEIVIQSDLTIYLNKIKATMLEDLQQPSRVYVPLLIRGIQGIKT